MSNYVCKYCGCKGAIYYNEMIDAHYCPDCSQKAREEWVETIAQLVVSDTQEDE